MGDSDITDQEMCDVDQVRAANRAFNNRLNSLSQDAARPNKRAAQEIRRYNKTAGRVQVAADQLQKKVDLL